MLQTKRASYEAKDVIRHPARRGMDGAVGVGTAGEVKKCLPAVGKGFLLVLSAHAQSTGSVSHSLI